MTSARTVALQFLYVVLAALAVALASAPPSQAAACTPPVANEVACENTLENPALRALAQATSPNGVYAYGAVSTFPTNSWNSTNYWVDVLFDSGS